MNQRKRNQTRQRRRKKRIILRIIFLINIIWTICLIKVTFSDKNESDKKNKNINSNSAYSENVNSCLDINSSATTNIVFTDEKKTKFVKLYSDKSDIYKNITICIDPGHGGNDIGAKRTNGQTEKDDTLKLALITKEYLESVGMKVVMTRYKDVNISLSERKMLAEESGADILLSIHRNIYEGAEDINGIEAWINSSMPTEALTLSTSILSCIENEVPGINNRGIKSGSMDNPNENYAINKASMTSLILETGFISSKYDNNLFDKYTEDFAIGIAKGILNNIN